MGSASILFVSADTEAIAAVRPVAARLGAMLEIAGSFAEAASAMSRRAFDAVLVQVDDCQPPIQRALALADSPPRLPPVVAVARKGSILDAVQAVQAGACDYFTVLTTDTTRLTERLRSAISRPLERGRSRSEPSGQPMPFPQFLTADSRALAAGRTAARFADTDVVVRVVGENGTGKSFLAEQVHLASNRRFARFVEVNCGALTPAQLERELFGMGSPGERPGHGQAQGALELANGGSLLLCQVGRAAPALQARLLRTLQKGGHVRSSNGRLIGAEFRLLVAATVPAEDDDTDGPLTSALRHEMDVVTVALPPLRERVADVPLLARHFMHLSAAEYGRQVGRISPEALDALVRYGWPGNVRELRNAFQFAVLLARGPAVRLEDLPEPVLAASRAQRQYRLRSEPLFLKAALREPERLHILRALKMTNWNKQQAARGLQISRSTLYKKMREHGLEPETATAGQ